MTPTHVRLLRIFADRECHPVVELRTALWDELSGVGSLRYHICTLRRVLRTIDQGILTRYEAGVLCYQVIDL